MDASPRNAERIRELDGLRGLAALAVVLFHYTYRFGELFHPLDGLWIDFPRGDYGVHLFFMLSGYVIFMTLDRTRRAADFVVGRFARLYPTYWAAMLTTFAATSLAGLPGQEVGLRDMLVNLTMVQQLFNVPHVDGAYWSLQAELMFYAATLVLHCTGCLRNAQRTLWIWLGCAVAVACAVWWLPAGITRVLGPLQTLCSLRYIHLFAIGMAFYRQRRDGVFDPGWTILVAVSCLWHAAVDSASGAAIVAAFSVLLYTAANGHIAWLAARPLVFLGAISYPLYLVHQNIGYIWIRRLDAGGWNANAAVLSAVVLAAFLATMLRRCVEQPAMAWIKSRYAQWNEVPSKPRKRWTRRRATA